MNRYFNRSKVIISATVAAIYAVSLASCSGTPINNNDTVSEDNSVVITEPTNSDTQPSSVPTVEESSKPEEPTGTTSARLVCVGDNLIHDNIYLEALEKGGGVEYDFSYCYEHVKK